MNETRHERQANLDAWLAQEGAIVVAFSGGVDSTYLAHRAQHVLGARAVAVTAVSEIYPQVETESARSIAAKLGLVHRELVTRELDRPGFAENSPLRCYHCKQELFGRLFEVAREYGIGCVADGKQSDDRADFRPGAKAARELGIRSPLADLGFTKEDIRELSREAKLPTWDKAPHPCLSTRFAYGMTITSDALENIESAEALLRGLGVGELRIRSHGEIARIEVTAADMGLFLDPEIGPRVVADLKKRGYKYVTLDLEGFRSGSMNEILRSRA